MFFVSLFCLGYSVHSYRQVGYYTGWSIYARKYQVSDIPFANLTHINYAFANIVNGRISLGDPWADVEKQFPGDSTDPAVQPFRGNFWQLLHVAKKQFPRLKVLISIGGWTWSSQFSSVAKTDASRQLFVESVISFVQQYGFDGVDVDWEYPVLGGLEGNPHDASDAENYNMLLKLLRSELDKIPGSGSTKRLLSIAAPAAPQNIAALKIGPLSEIVDFVNLMAYDFRGNWSKYTGAQAPLYPASTILPDDPEGSFQGIASSVQLYLDAGMQADQINLGVPFYGRGWNGVASAKDLFQTFKGTPRGTWDSKKAHKSEYTGVFDYWHIEDMIADNDLVRYFDNATATAWAYSKGDQLLISFDDRRAISQKINFVHSKGLGGMMYWDLSGDRYGELTLMISQAIYNLPVTPPPKRSRTWWEWFKSFF